MRTTRLAAVLCGAAASVLLLAGPASAHVTVKGDGATQGGFTKLTFRVPTEESVPTTKIEITFPADAPLGFAAIKPHPGWTYKVTKIKPAKPITTDDGQVDSVVHTITWTATAGGIKPGEFDEFEVSAGPLPTVDQMVFKAVQTYANGDVVRWIELPTAGGAEPAKPAPTLKLAPASTTSSQGQASPSPSPSAAEKASSDSSAKALGGAGLGVAVVAALLALVALVRSRKA